jgi:hypothetical protein
MIPFIIDFRYRKSIALYHVYVVFFKKGHIKVMLILYTSYNKHQKCSFCVNARNAVHIIDDLLHRESDTRQKEAVPNGR